MTGYSDGWASPPRGGSQGGRPGEPATRSNGQRAVPGGRRLSHQVRIAPGAESSHLTGEKCRALRPRTTGKHAGRRKVPDAVRAHPNDQHHGQSSQQPGQPRKAVPGVHEDDDGRVEFATAHSRDQPGHHITQLHGDHIALVVVQVEKKRVKRKRPRRPARPERGNERVRPARDHLQGVTAAPVHMAEHLTGLVTASGLSQLQTSTASRSGSPASPAAAAPPASAAAVRTRPGPNSARHTAPRDPVRTPAPATAARGESQAGPRTAPHRQARKAHQPAALNTGTAPHEARQHVTGPVRASQAASSLAPGHESVAFTQFRLERIECGIHMIMKIPFDYVAPCRGRRVPAGARALPSPPATAVNGTGWRAPKLGGQSPARPR